MTKNITLTADESLIRKARERAMRDHTTLNETFRLWLARYVAQDEASGGYEALMARLSYARPGGRFARDEANER